MVKIQAFWPFSDVNSDSIWNHSIKLKISIYVWIYKNYNAKRNVYTIVGRCSLHTYKPFEINNNVKNLTSGISLFKSTIHFPRGITNSRIIVQLGTRKYLCNRALHKGHFFQEF